MSETSTRVVIADDHTILREALRQVLTARREFTVVGEAANGREAVAVVTRTRPDLLLLDVSMPEASGLDALRELAAIGPGVRTLVLTASIDRLGMLAALQLGARGVVLKTAGTKVLLEAIEAVLAGEYWVDRRSVSNLFDVLKQLSGPASPTQRKFGLTERQLEIVTAVVAGLTNREIAAKLKIAEDTVKHHLSQVFDKTGVSSRLELAMLATHHGLV
ncbi:MAG TPA: response regulator transcription factor [Vicinamibacterales bacterium]|jgi:DNA-binding NarL/FixJ family response regulator|nr:response regulator transcription factor [Vicinamibacterales bacterium]